MAVAVVVALRGPALELLQTLPIAKQSNYEALVAALERRYGDQHRKGVYQTQLKARQQKTGENLQEFEAEIRRLVHLAYPAVPDEIQE